MESQLDYNILLGKSFMYTMKAITLSIICIMMFPHDGKVVTIDEITYNPPGSKGSPDGVISSIQKDTFIK